MSEQSPLSVKQRGFRYQIWLMLMIIFGVIASGFILMPKTEQQRQKMIELFGTTNQGQLVKPAVDLSSLLADFSLDDKPKWQVIIAGGNGCDQNCEQVLFSTKQIHMLLGKLTGRVQRLYLPDASQLQVLDLDRLHLEHPYLQVSAIESSQLSDLLRNSSADWDMRDTRYFVVTPDHQAILYYTATDDAGGLLDDLKHLLKYSPDR
ncbi:MAG: hypothetical protein NZ697_03525 [Porticoccaceae bacterium]|nr:hypothetical protein [Porticoccaceae bacterium]